MSSDYKRVIQRLRSGLGSQVFYQTVNLFIRLAEVPLFLVFWGAERYGEWLMVAAIPAYLAMADGGFTGTTQREMNMCMGAEDRQGALAAFQSTWVLLLIVSAVGIVASTLLATLLPLDQWLNLKSIRDNTLAIVILLLTTHIFICFQCGLIYGGYSCEGRYGRGTYLTAITYLFDFGGLALAVTLGGGPVTAASGLLAGRLIGFLLFLLDQAKVIPWLSFGWKHASRAQVAKLLRPSLASLAFPLGEAMNIQGMRLVVGLILGPAAVAVFSSIRTLCRSTMKPVTIAARLIEPEIALAYGASHFELIRKLFIRSSQITLWTTMFACAVLWLSGEFLFGLWTKNYIALDAPLFLILLLASAVNCLWSVGLMVPYATNRHQGIALFYTVTQLGGLLLTVLFSCQLGIYGAGLALMTVESVLTFGVLAQALKLIGVTFSAWALTVIYPPVYLLSHVSHSFLKNKQQS
jgi:O-antigen/teichoic acid export membrane protein